MWVRTVDEDTILLKIKVLYQKYTKKDFEEYYKTMKEDTPAGIDINSLIKKNIKPTKRRWKKSIINDPDSDFNKEIDFIKIQFDKKKNGKISDDKLTSIIGGVDTVEDYINNILMEIDHWINDDNQYLCEFKYLNGLSKRSITTAIKYDLVMINARQTNIEIPSILSNIPIDVTNRVDYLNAKQKESLIKNPVTKLDKIISLEDDEKEQLIMEIERTTYLAIKQGANPNKYVDMMAQIALIKSIKYLNAFDVKVIIYYYSFRNIMGDDYIDKSLYEILVEMNLPTGGKYYDQLENSIAKLGSLRLTYEIKGQRYNGSLLSDIGIYYEDNKMKTKRARVYLGSLLKAFSSENFVLEYDKELFDNLSNTAKQVAIWLQKRRYKLALSGQKLEENIPLISFSNAIYFGTRRKDRIRTEVEKALKEVESNQKIIDKSEYVKTLDIARIKYKPLSINEMKKLKINIEEDANTILIESGNIGQIE